MKLCKNSSMTLTKRPCKEHFQSTEQDLFFFFVHATPTVFLTDFTPLKPYMMADSLKCTAKFIEQIQSKICIDSYHQNYLNKLPTTTFLILAIPINKIVKGLLKVIKSLYRKI